jgi:hypothetical protein
MRSESPAADPNHSDDAHIPSQGGAARDRHERGMECDGRGLRRKACDIDADGEGVWYQCRRFEVPAAIAASSFQELQIEDGTGIKYICSCPCFPKFAIKWALRWGANFGKRARVHPWAGAKSASTTCSRATVTNKVMDIGESAQKAVNHRAGKAGSLLFLVCLSPIAHEAMGAASARLSLRPPCFGGTCSCKDSGNSGAART